jgi:Icc-related predicted phosphoesterase
MQIVMLSDTHCQLGNFSIPEGDLLLHAGDLTFRGNVQEMTVELKKLGEIAKNFKYGCVYTCGNHDFLGEKNSDLLKMLSEENNLIWLQDSGITINGFNIWGSAWTPEFGGWAFNLKRGDPLKEKWDLIPENTNILITHGPPKGYGDTVLEGDGDEWPFTDFKYKKINVGCKALADKVKLLPNLKLHIFGHIHSGNGQYKSMEGKLFVNASVCNEKYNTIQPVHIVDL